MPIFGQTPVESSERRPGVLPALLERMCAELGSCGLDATNVALLGAVAGRFPGTIAVAHARDGRCTWVSRGFQAETGIRPEAVLGHQPGIVFPARWCQERLGVIARAIRERSIVATVEVFRGRRMEGAAFPVLGPDAEAEVLYIGRFGVSTDRHGVRRGAEAAADPEYLVEADWGALGVLTRRELEVLRLVAQGLDNAEIAASIHRTKRAVEWHIRNLYELLRCDRRTELFRLGVFAGLGEIDDEHWRVMMTRVHDGWGREIEIETRPPAVGDAAQA